MDAVTLALAKQYTDSQRLAYREVGSATERQTLPFSRQEIIGKTIECDVSRYRIKKNLNRPVGETSIILATNGPGMSMTYENGEGMFDKNVLLIVTHGVGFDMTQLSPAFAEMYPDYNALFYLYETTSVPMLGMTAPPGWYAGNLSTFAVAPFDIEACPVYVPDFLFADDYIFTLTVHDDYFYEIAERDTKFTFVVTPEHCFVEEDNPEEPHRETVVFVMPVKYMPDSSETELYYYIACVVYDNTDGTCYFRDGFGKENVVVRYETIHPIDPEYIPPMDSVTLNSPGGKKFAVTVDDTGALTTTEVST